MVSSGGPTEGSEQPITEQDVAGFAEKLEQWGNSLPPAEQALLTLILARAKSTEAEEVEGMSSPTVGLSAAQTRSWVTPWVVNQNLSYTPYLKNASFAKDTGPSWVNSPRMAGGLGQQVIR